MVANRAFDQMTGAGEGVKNRVDFVTAAEITLFARWPHPRHVFEARHHLTAIGPPGWEHGVWMV